MTTSKFSLSLMTFALLAGSAAAQSDLVARLPAKPIPAKPLAAAVTAISAAQAKLTVAVEADGFVVLSFARCENLMALPIADLPILVPEIMVLQFKPNAAADLEVTLPIPLGAEVYLVQPILLDLAAPRLRTVKPLPVDATLLRPPATETVRASGAASPTEA